MIRRKMLMARFVSRGGRKTPRLLAAKILPYRWNYVGASYDKDTGVAKLYINTRMVAKRKIGKMQLSTNSNAVAGAKPGDKKRFRGMISCIQIYNRALTTAQVIVVRNRCFKGGTDVYRSVVVRVFLFSVENWSSDIVLLVNNVGSCFFSFSQRLKP